MSQVTVYGLKNCDSCRKARQWLQGQGAAFDFVDYREQPVPAATLKAWARAAGGWEQLVNRRSSTWRKLPEADKHADSDAARLALVQKHPTLVKRPVLAHGDAVHIGFNQAAWQASLRHAA